MTDLSPAAQAVLDAYWDGVPLETGLACGLAAALRAAADQVWTVQWDGRMTPDASHGLGINWSRDALYAIAAELEGSNE